MLFVHVKIAGNTGIRAGTGRNAAHKGPAFLPWHRVYVQSVERALQVYCPAALLNNFKNTHLLSASFILGGCK